MSTTQTNTPQKEQQPQKQPTDQMSSGSCGTNKEKSGGCGCG